MRSQAEKLLVVESDDHLRDHIVAVLSDAGYEVSTDYEQGIKAVLAFDPDAVVMGADPPQLDCCDLLSEIKGSERSQNIRVVMLSPGGSAERTRGLELGADDVVSVPFDSHELLSRVRSQLRNKSVADGFRQRLRRAEENQNTAQQVVTAVNEERRTLRVGGLATVAVLIVASLVLLFFYRRTQEQNTRGYAAITRLQTGVLTEQQLMERSRRALEDRDRGPSPAGDPQKLQLQKKSEDLRSQIATSKTENVSVLQSQLAAVESRLQKIETDGKFAERIIQAYEPSVCLIHVVLAFREHTTGLRLRYAGVTSTGAPETDEHNNPLVTRCLRWSRAHNTPQG